jgi:hypothetical protein
MVNERIPQNPTARTFHLSPLKSQSWHARCKLAPQIQGENIMAQEREQPHNKDQAGGETRTEKAERIEENRQEKKDDHQTGAGRHRGTNKHGTE